MIDFCELKHPFPPEDIEWRVQQAGAKGGKPWAMVLAYVTNRAIMNRLDEVCGPANWHNQFITGPDGGVLCGISIKVSDSEWVTKWDGADKTQVEAVKGGLSGSMKRAAVQWGIGRYLYNLDATFAEITDKGKHYQPKNDKKQVPAFKWNPPKLPAWALPENCKQNSGPPASKPDAPKLATREQADKLMELGKDADVEMIEGEVKEMIVYFRKGDKLTWDEAVDLINNFNARQVQYIQACSQDQGATCAS